MNRPRPEIPGVYSLQACAAAVGVSAERLRKAWRAWSRDRAFPAPFGHPPYSNYAWYRDDVDAWIAARTGALTIAAPPPAHQQHPANDAWAEPRQGHRRAINRARGALRALAAS